MQILPVLDLQGGCVVRGIGGRRSEYRPLTPICHPLSVAESFRENFGVTELYLADLDAIAGAAPALAIYSDLQRSGFQLWVDAGIREPEQGERLLAAGIETVIVGLETVSGPAVVEGLCQDSAERIVFSLDLREGVPVGDLRVWKRSDALSIAQQALELGVRRLLLLDLARVGMNSGTGTEALAKALIVAHPHVAVSVGGGIRDEADLRRLKTIGVRSVLVASALHDGQIQRSDLLGL
jgi:phosphoribosylformimino-5-aminoimidazole carboxamide ribotide isomerase